MPPCLSSTLDDKSSNPCMYKLIFWLKRIFLILFNFPQIYSFVCGIDLISSQMLHNWYLFLILWLLLCFCVEYPLLIYTCLHWSSSSASYGPSCLSQLPTLLSTEHVSFKNLGLRPFGPVLTVAIYFIGLTGPYNSTVGNFEDKAALFIFNIKLHLGGSLWDGFWRKEVGKRWTKEQNSART